MKLLVTGAHGLLGRSLLEADWGAGVELMGCGRGPQAVGEAPYREVDLMDPEQVRRLVREARPDRVIHTAALTDVDRCEREPQLARRINRDAVAHVVAACADIGAGVVQLSTDYVFDGAAGPYSEGDATNPLSHYGRIKLESEGLVLDGAAEGLVVRTLWLYGHQPGARRNLVTWSLAALAQGDRLRVVSDQWGNPTFADDLARALVELCRRGRTGLYHMGGATFLTRLELVRQVAGHFGLDAATVEAVTTPQAAQAAPRPLRSGLRCERLTRELGWVPATLEDGLRRLAALPGFRRDFGALLDLASA